ncbi:sensor histidine kinase, partial [Pseudomonas sp. MWU13-2625]
PRPKARLEMAHDVPLAQPALAHVLFRSAQEALSNALRHSGAARAVVRLERLGGGVALTVSDNGVGLAASNERRQGHGLAGMRERVEASVGTLDILSPASGGCCVRIWLPLTGEAS